MYDGMWHRGFGPNVLQHMFPIDVLRIEPHTVWGTQRIVTSVSGTYQFARRDSHGYATRDAEPMAATVYLYLKGGLVRIEAKPATETGVVITLAPAVADMAVIVRNETAPRRS